MIDLYKAIDIFQNKIKNGLIGAIADVGHSFIFWEADENGEFLEASATAINKVTGKVTAYFEPEHWDELDKAIEIEVPKRYS